MRTQLKRIALVVGLAALAGVAFLIGQMSAPSAVSAQSPCVVAATHTGIWQGMQLTLIWDADRPAVATLTSSTREGVALDGDMSRGVGATVIGRKIRVQFTGSGDRGTYMITTTVPCQ